MEATATIGPGTCDVRARMTELTGALPRALRRPLVTYFTWLTGKPERGEVPALHLGPLADTAWTLVVLVAGVALSAVALQRGPPGWLLLAPGWVLTTGSLRKLFIAVQHGLVHGALASSAANRLATDALAIVGLLPGHAKYRAEHVVRHHGTTFGGSDDPDAALLLAFGLAPGIPRARLWRRFARTLLSPRFHVLYARERLTDVFLRGARSRRLLAFGLWSAVLVGVHSIDGWVELVLAWLVPAFPLFHAAALAAIVGEHLWFTPREPGETMARYQRRLTSARFVGSAPPPPDGPASLRALRWLAWWLAHLTYWPAVRIAIVPGDLPAHDFHHAHPNVVWTDAIRERQRALERGEPFTEVWGAFAAIDRTFANLARLAPDGCARAPGVRAPPQPEARERRPG